ncbi:multidrug efflux transcriptional regulator BltR [Alkalibacterium iburiense]|uniref:Multidrug efflux transcriptional regulator BltR n=1 Tax=Alkalibacterium iburiense TaxID=290589 RepID=A0ABN0XSK4_9LACT
MPKNPSLLSTGQFAKLVGVSKHTLFFYDEKDIFSPLLRKDNGYRYYSIRQIETFLVISSLKDLGMPLEDIKSYLTSRSPDALVQLLDKETHKLDKRINHLKGLKEMMEEKKSVTKKAMDADLSVFTIERQRKKKLLITEVKDVLNSKQYYEAFQKHYSILYKEGKRSSWLEGLMVPVSETYTMHTGYRGYLYTVVENPAISNHTLTEGDYLIGYFKGDDEAIEEAHHQLISYAKEQGYTFGDYIFEDVVLDELAIRSYNQYVYKLALQIKD